MAGVGHARLLVSLSVVFAGTGWVPRHQLHVWQWSGRGGNGRASALFAGATAKTWPSVQAPEAAMAEWIVGVIAAYRKMVVAEYFGGRARSHEVPPETESVQPAHVATGLSTRAKQLLLAKVDLVHVLPK